MNFNYSYKAFLIATLLVGNLVLLIYSVKLTKKEKPKEEEYDLEYALEDLFPEEKLAAISTENLKIETHKAFNEAEQFIANQENERRELSENTQDKLDEMTDAIKDITTNKISFIKAEKSLENEEKSKTLLLNKEAEDKAYKNKNSTNSYRLVDRKAIYFPNPVYICDGFGKVVLHIEVSNLGKVIQATLNKNSTTTTNACLIESAINYAKKARFNTDASKPVQLGSITYIFPGQS